MNRQQKRARRMRRKTHMVVANASTKPKIRSFTGHDGKTVELEVPRGPRKREGSYHKSDPPKHGAIRKAADQRKSMLARNLAMGFATGGIVKPEGMAVIHGPETIIPAGDMAKLVSDDLIVTDRPSEQEWEEILAHAKRRKRGISWAAQRAGFDLIEGMDKSERESWLKS